MKIKGVNLGNWLVLEKWMSSELFYGIDADDEEDFYNMLSPEEARLRIRMHRDYFIQERDFQHIKHMGLNAIRIPVPHYIFGDKPPYIGCIEYLDKAFDWAEKYGLKILIDIHTVSDSQNGFDNGGLTGVVKWHQKQENIDETVALAGQLAERYAKRQGLYGIELLNEPISEFMCEFTKERYIPRDIKRAEGSGYVPSEVLRNFYLRGYEEVRRHTQEAKIVLHDGFRLSEWDDFMVTSDFRNVVIDTHLYLSFHEQDMPERELEDYAKIIRERFEKVLMEAGKTHDIIVGEWCIANRSYKLKDLDDVEKKLIYRTIGDMELKAWNKSAGWFFWSYKLHAPDRNDWDFCRAIESGWLNL